MPWVIRFVVVGILGPRLLRRAQGRWGGPPGSRRAQAVDVAVGAATQYGRVRRLVFVTALVAVVLAVLLLAGLVGLLVWAF